MFDYASREMIIQTLKMGARYIELDVFLNKRKELVVGNMLLQGNWNLNI